MGLGWKNWGIVLNQNWLDICLVGELFPYSKNRYPILHDHNLIKKNLAYILTEKNRLFDHFGSDY